MFATLGTGGSLLMAPLKWMEDNRQKNAARIDHALGTTPPDPETIAQEPKQTWKSVMSGRLLSWGTSYGAFLAMGPKLTGTISNWFGEKASEGFMKMKPNANPATVRRWADIAAFDALFTVITAGITYLYSRHVAKEDDKGTTQREAHPTPSALPQDSEKDDVKSTRFTDTIKTSNRQITVPQGAFAGRLGSEAETSAGHAI